MANKKPKLAIIALGKPNAGKSTTWYELYGQRFKTGWKEFIIKGKKIIAFVQNSSNEELAQKAKEYFKIFIRNSSFEESKVKAKGYKPFQELPDVIICSVQYSKGGLETMDWFRDNGYYLYIQWLNPGYNDKPEYEDHLNFEKSYAKYGEFHKRSGKEVKKRAEEVKQFLYEWFINI